MRRKSVSERAALARAGLRLKVPPPRVMDRRPSRSAEKARMRREIQRELAN